jgi:thymidylate synthase
MKQYHELLNIIKEKGSYKEAAREGMPGTLSRFGHQFRIDLTDGFPLLTTKKLSFKNIVVELLWFLRGDTNIKYLIDNGCNIWNEDAYNYYVKQCNKNKPVATPPMDYDIFVEFIKKGYPVTNMPDSSYILGDCGFQYGRVWRHWESGKEISIREGFYDNGEIKWKFGKETTDQLAKVIENIKTKPYDRRKVITAVDPAHDEDLALYWCHCLFQFNCRKLSISDRFHLKHNYGDNEEFSFHPNSWDKNSQNNYHKQLSSIGVPEYYLDCQLYQRSADVFLGVPYNIASYALLTHIISKICNMIPGEFIHTFGDVHIYDNHIEQVNEQLKRDYNKYKLPTLKISKDAEELLSCNSTSIGELNGILYALQIEDFSVEGYESYPTIKGELSTGLKKS